MKLVKDYRNRIISLFYTSVDKDIDNWSIEDNDAKNIFSPIYGDFRLNIDLSKKKLYLQDLSSKQYTVIVKYSFFKNWKIRKYAKRLKNNEIHKKENQQNIETINKLKAAINNMESFYVRDIRKEKLKKIDS